MWCLYTSGMTTFQWAQLSLQAISAIGVIVALSLTIRQIRLLRASYVDLHDWNRRKAAQDATHEWKEYAADSVALEDKFHFRQLDGVVELAVLTNTFKEDLKLRASLHRILNYFEAIANGVRNGVFDESVIHDAFCAVFDLHIHRFGQYIKHRRASGATIWIEFDELNQKWVKKDQERPRRSNTGIANSKS